MSLAAFGSVAIAVFAVLAVAFMVLAVRAERRGSASATVLRGLGAVCAVLAGAAYVLPSLLIIS